MFIFHPRNYVDRSARLRERFCAARDPRDSALKVVMFALTVIGASLPTSPARASESAATAEYEVKAAHLFNVAKFVEWPVTSLFGADRSFVIAVIDRGEAAPVLGQFFANKEIAGRPVDVRPVSLSSMPTDAHILLVTRAAGVAPEDAHRALGPAPTLLVGETEKFAERSGAIAFVPEGGAFRLILCREHATEKGLKVSARLATVARQVRPAPKP